MSSVSAIAPQVALMLGQDGIEDLDFTQLSNRHWRYTPVNQSRKGVKYGAPWSAV